MNSKELEKKAKAYSLKNAIVHNGKANQGAVISALFNEGLKKNDIPKHIEKISKIVLEVNSFSFEKQKDEFENLKDFISERKVREGLPELPNINSKKGIIMRFAPSPSGPFHIGHAMTACLSFLYVKKYGGKFYVRIEDTNPENIYPLSYKMIEEESKWLFDNSAKIIIQSDRVDIYYKYAEKLIKKNFAYVCTCSGDKFREFSKNKKDCLCRKLSIKENSDRWEKMIFYDHKRKKGYSEGEAVLRFKTPGKGMQVSNPAMRDFPLARINESKHVRQGDKYRVWPLMNLAVSVDDIEMKMTHIIRAKDHRDNAKRQEMIYNALELGKKIPWSGFLGRFKFKDMELSATKMRQEIEKGKYTGWDDPRLPTIASLKKKGYSPKAFWKFAERIGLSETDKVMDGEEYFKLLDFFNKEK